MSKSTTKAPLRKAKCEPLFNSDFELRYPRILLFDIETAPNLSYIWGHYDQNALKHVMERYILSVAYKWLGEDEVRVMSIRDYKGYKPLRDCDRGLVKDLWKLFDEADIIVGHNLDSFDIKMANSRFLKYGFDPPSFYRTIDTKVQAKRYFRQNSNKLDDLGNFLGVGRKMKHQGFDMWVDCMSGVPEAWDEMLAYNKQDVLLLERVYLKMRAWMTQHPNLNVLMNRDLGCSKCGSLNVVFRGDVVWTNMSRAKRYYCKDCRGYSQSQYKKVSSMRAS
ncbi:MAG: ribonuclease H-like domain-containing protein [Pyrinomonadaceae bacterium]